MKDFQSFTRIVAFFALLGPLAGAQVYLDIEKDPIPLFDLSLVLPQGSASADASESVNLSLLAPLIEAGTMRLNREEFNDALGEFGASLSYSMTGQYSTWSLSFPYREGQDYKKLVALLKENWEKPRFTPEEFQRYRTMGLNNLRASLNSDGQLLTSTLRRWIFKNFLGFAPLYQESFQRAKLDTIRELFKSKVQSPSQIWAGFVGPESLRPLVKTIVTEVFHLTDFREGKLLEPLATHNLPTVSERPQSKTLLIVSKSGRTQNVTALFAFNPKKLAPARELDFLIGEHVAISGGLGSLYSEALRTKGGFSYTVASTSTPSFAGYPILGFYSNPMSSKQDGAMQSISKLLHDSFEGDLFNEVSPEDWKTRIKAFRYEKTFSEMTPAARLGERQSVVTGLESAKLYLSDPLDWNAKAGEVQAYFRSHWKDAQIVLGIVGDERELKLVAQKYFSDFQVKVIPYVETISAKAFD